MSSLGFGLGRIPKRVRLRRIANVGCHGHARVAMLNVEHAHASVGMPPRIRCISFGPFIRGGFSEDVSLSREMWCRMLRPGRPGRCTSQSNGKTHMSRSATPPTNDPPATHSVWLRLDRTQWTTLIVTIGVFGALVFPRVIWAPCLGDPGEVQLTAAIGGLGHPPGHAGIITIFRVFCLLSPIAPHLSVSAVNAAFALAAVAILMVLMRRTGVNPVAAALASFLFLSDDQFWHASITPETYATCVLLLIASTWAFLSWLNDQRSWKLWLAVFLFAFLCQS